MPVRIKQTPLTRLGREEIALEISCLETIRNQALSESQHCDETATVAAHEASAINHEIASLRVVLQESLDIPDDTKTVAVGCEFTVTDGQIEETFTIVGPLAANHAKHRISYTSALAQTVLGGTVGDEFEPVDEHGPRRLHIAAVKPATQITSLGA